MFQLSPECQNSRENVVMELNMFLCVIMVKDQERYPPVPHSCINCTFPGQNVTYDVQKDTVSRIREVIKGVDF
jgi:hypothetical protein